jgi:putative lipoic acid-binding regulatory protein
VLAEQETLLEFPCDFPLKIMGAINNGCATGDGFAQAIVEVVLKHAPDFDAARVEMRPSRAGNYLSLTCTIRAASKSQLDALYRELTGHPWVKIVL